MDKQNNRTAARLFAVQFTYHLFLKPNDDLKKSFESQALGKDELHASINNFLETYREPDIENPDSAIAPDQLQFATRILETFLAHYPDISRLLEGAIHTSIEKVPPFDQAALMIGITEIKYFETPFEVVTNELVTISKKYGSDSTSRFVNGVLDGIGKNK